MRMERAAIEPRPGVASKPELMHSPFKADGGSRASLCRTAPHTFSERSLSFNSFISAQPHRTQPIAWHTWHEVSPEVQRCYDSKDGTCTKQMAWPNPAFVPLWPWPERWLKHSLT